MAARGTVYQGIQVGVEVTPGTLVPATIRLTEMEMQMTPNIPMRSVKYPGAKVTTGTQRGHEHTVGRVTGVLDFNTALYTLSSLFNTQSPGAPFTGATAKQRVWTPSPIAPLSPQTYSIEQGSSRGAERVGYAFFDGLTMHGTNEEAAMEATFIAQNTIRDWTMTPGLPILKPAAVNPINVGLWYSTDGIAWTKLLKPLDWSFHFTGLYQPVFHVNDSIPSFDDQTERLPDIGGTITWEESTEVDTQMANLYANTLVYLGFKATGATIDTAVTVANPTTAPTNALAAGGTLVSGTALYTAYTWVNPQGETTASAASASITPSAGNLSVTVTIPALPAGVTSANVYVGTSATVSTMTKSGNTTETTYTITAMPGGGAANPPVSNTATGVTSTNLMQVRMPIFITRPEPGDKAGVYGNTLTFEAALDAGFGETQITLINLLASL